MKITGCYEIATAVEGVIAFTEGVVGGLDGAAARLGLPRTTLIAKMRRLGVNRF
jgi:transcriptional regulator of acetoin/glycerol metabolism